MKFEIETPCIVIILQLIYKILAPFEEDLIQIQLRK